MSYERPYNLIVNIPQGEDGKTKARLSWNEEVMDQYGPVREVQRKTILSAISYNDNSQSYQITTAEYLTQYIFSTLMPGTLYQFQVCYDYGARYAKEYTDPVAKTTNGKPPGTTPSRPPKHSPTDFPPTVVSIQTEPSSLKSRSFINVKWTQVMAEAWDDDFSWEWEELSPKQHALSLENPEINISPVLPDCDYRFRVRLINSPIHFEKKSDWRQLEIRSPTPLKSIKAFLRGESGNQGLRKLLCEFNHDTTSLLKVLRT